MQSILSSVSNKLEHATWHYTNKTNQDTDTDKRRQREEGDAKCLEDFDAPDVKGIKADVANAVSSEKSDLPGETLIFVDADGVINVGIRDGPGQAPILLSESNLNRAKLGTGGLCDMIQSVANRNIGPEDDLTYADLATAPGSLDISPILAGRLGRIIEAAGQDCTLVLSSSWRKASHRPRVEALEKAISQHCRRPVAFKNQTGPGGDDSPVKRVMLIGDFVSECSERRLQKASGPLRVLVIDDFCATHPSRWKGATMNSVTDVEENLRQRSATPENTFVKLIHTYEKWCTEAGNQVQIGSGLTMKNVLEAEKFVACQISEIRQTSQ